MASKRRRCIGPRYDRAGALQGDDERFHEASNGEGRELNTLCKPQAPVPSPGAKRRGKMLKQVSKLYEDRKTLGVVMKWLDVKVKRTIYEKELSEALWNVWEEISQMLIERGESPLLWRRPQPVDLVTCKFSELTNGDRFYQQDLSGTLLRNDDGEVLVFVRLRSREAQRLDGKGLTFSVTYVDTPVLIPWLRK